MKKKVLTLIFSVVVLSSVLTGCSTGIVSTEETYGTEKNIKAMFVEVEKTNSWRIVYDKETKVMYAVAKYGSGSGQFTLLVDENGNPKLWDGE